MQRQKKKQQKLAKKSQIYSKNRIDKFLQYDPDQEIDSDYSQDQSNITDDDFNKKEQKNKLREHQQDQVQQKKLSVDQQKARLAKRLIALQEGQQFGQNTIASKLYRDKIQNQFIQNLKTSDNVKFYDPYLLKNPDLVSKKLREEILIKEGKYFQVLSQSIEAQTTPDFYRGHKKMPTCLESSRDGSLIFSGSKDCSIIVWHFGQSCNKKTILSGKKHDRNQKGHFDQILSLALSQDQRTLLSAGCSVKSFRGHRDYITGLKFDSSFEHFYSISADRSLKMWSFRDSIYLDTYYGHRSLISDIDNWQKDRVITCGHDNQIILWKINQESQLLYKPVVSFTEAICSLSDQHFVSGGQRNSISLWSLGKKKPLKTTKDPTTNHFIQSLTCVKNSDIFCAGSTDGTVNLFKLNKEQKNFQLIQQFSSTKQRSISSVKLIKNGSRLVVAQGQQQRLGRWFVKKHSRSGLSIYKLIRD